MRLAEKLGLQQVQVLLWKVQGLRGRSSENRVVCPALRAGIGPYQLQVPIRRATPNVRWGSATSGLQRSSLRWKA